MTLCENGSRRLNTPIQKEPIRSGGGDGNIPKFATPIPRSKGSPYTPETQHPNPVKGTINGQPYRIISGESD
ncbi:hypothetical protein COX08_04260 [Candidatus Beckwithbacteria bacterium CG23_combo_of_CG06-09_8_20_14_all_34_8]|uniref:Uncharacterized protein n=1 Tax=Candidatus Beckwithbacteria bacterium CG23_combo_of_CG06-09_8_20_14_all_34_8 TaxID=1974497 RepID=A0A2H0B5B4_9BACT|nr:MAG: hypothetical protein COX08_04260 [Candidatus Beckwithbacteria bacterium CG23_combo_of_CG06-09_8_20_14_all_34_8]